MSRAHRLTFAFLVAGLALLAREVQAASGAQRCTRALWRAAGKHAACVFNARARAVTQDAGPDYSVCEDRYGAKVRAVRQRYGGSCPQQLWVGGSQRFTDNGDGTVIDHGTGLQWEKKTSLDGKPDSGDPHDADNTYTWSAARGGTAADGSAFAVFLTALNTGPCFAGHCDWRLPTLAELRTILLTPNPCAANPCIDPVFGPTAGSTYWSGTTSVYHPRRAWYVFFVSGLVSTSPKDAGINRVRAVRTVR